MNLVRSPAASPRPGAMITAGTVTSAFAGFGISKEPGAHTCAVPGLTVRPGTVPIGDYPR